MIPTLLGRWQTRLILFLFIGLPVTFLFSLALSDWRFPIVIEPFLFIGTLLVVGLLLDIVYQFIQRFRWDADWPFALFVIASIAEFFIVYGLVWFDLLPWLPWVTRANGERVPPVDLLTAAIHFSLVFLPSFIAVLAIVQLFLLRWRYKGGEIGRLPISE